MDKAAAIAAALSSRTKQTYYAGQDAWLYRLLTRLLPQRRRDWLTLRTIGLDTKLPQR